MSSQDADDRACESSSREEMRLRNGSVTNRTRDKQRRLNIEIMLTRVYPQDFACRIPRTGWLLSMKVVFLQGTLAWDNLSLVFAQDSLISFCSGNK
ncbi:hypothetical protein J6590_094612 [Homalodisca vitripennis]|nr:hypothetical protein J6590_094612 [Homalodisca vitripennis]